MIHIYGCLTPLVVIIRLRAIVALFQRSYTSLVRRLYNRSGLAIPPNVIIVLRIRSILQV